MTCNNRNPSRFFIHHLGNTLYTMNIFFEIVIVVGNRRKETGGGGGGGGNKKKVNISINTAATKMEMVKAI